MDTKTGTHLLNEPVMPTDSHGDVHSKRTGNASSASWSMLSARRRRTTCDGWLGLTGADCGPAVEAALLTSSSGDGRGSLMEAGCWQGSGKCVAGRGGDPEEEEENRRRAAERRTFRRARGNRSLQCGDCDRERGEEGPHLVERNREQRKDKTNISCWFV
jgi:hypothetical protein